MFATMLRSIDVVVVVVVAAAAKFGRENQGNRTKSLSPCYTVCFEVCVCVCAH